MRIDYEWPISPFPSPTTSATKPSSTNLVLGAVVTVLLAGTGGTTDYQYYQKRQSLGYPVMGVKTIEFTVPVHVRNASESLARIREVFNPSISDLANVFGVSRQSVYNWLANEQPSSDHVAKLDDWATAADTVAREGVPVTSHILKRKISDGKNFYDCVREGMTAQDAAHNLILIMRREAEERKRLEQRLAGRKKPKFDIADAGLQLLQE